MAFMYGIYFILFVKLLHMLQKQYRAHHLRVCVYLSSICCVCCGLVAVVLERHEREVSSKYSYSEIPKSPDTLCLHSSAAWVGDAS